MIPLNFIIKLKKLLLKENINLLLIGSIKSNIHLLYYLYQYIKIFDKVSNEKCIDMVAKCHIGLSLRDTSDLSKNSFPVRVWEYLGLNIPSVVFPSIINFDQNIKKTNLVHFLPTTPVNQIKEIMIILKKTNKEFYSKNSEINHTLYKDNITTAITVHISKFLIKNF